MKKLMNRFFGVLCALILVVGCTDPLEDDINAIEADFAFAKDVEYTLTEDDYETLDGICGCTGFGNFGSEDDAKTNIPLILAGEYPGLGDGSSALVKYEFFRGFSEEVDPWLDIVDATRYEFDADDYAMGSAEAGENGYFNNSVTFEDNYNAILNAGIDSPTDGQIVAVTYEELDLDYADAFNSAYSEDFTSITDLSASDFEIFDISGAQGWVKYTSSFPYEAANMSGFSGGANANEDWLVSPEIDLTGFSDAELRIQQVLNFLGDQTYGEDIAIRVSTDYAGDPTAATWVDLDFDVDPAGDNWDPMDTKASLSDYEDMQIYISFYYVSTDSDAPNWRVIDIKVGIGEDVDTNTMNAFYSYSSGSNEWSLVDSSEAYFVSEPSYDAFGLSFPNFSSSDRAENYLPRFLTNSLRPYAQEDDTQIVIYDYFSSSSGVQVRGDFLTFTGGEWVVYQSVVETSLNFGHDGTEWVADNTIKYTLGTDDYAAIAAAYEESNPDGSSSMSTFGNYDLTLWSSEEIFDSITARLETLYGSIEADQKFLVDYAVWRPGAGVDQLNVRYDGSDWSYVTE